MMDKESVPYVALRKDEDAGGEEPATTAVAVDEESNGIPPEARGLVWNDTFYDSEDGVIAVFDIDSELIKKHFRRVQWFFLGFCLSYWLFLTLILVLDDDGDDGASTGFFFVFYFGLMLLIGYRLSKMKTGDIHVAVTREGVRKDVNAFPLGSMFHTTTMMPYSEIKSCSVHRTCGKCCGASHTVKIQALHDSSQHIVIGVKDPDAFVALVNAMMKNEAKSSNQLLLKAEVVVHDSHQASKPLL